MSVHRKSVIIGLILVAAGLGAGLGGWWYWRGWRADQLLAESRAESAAHRYEEAAELARQAAALRPGRGEIRLEAARASRRAGRPDLAEPHLDAAIKLLGETEEVRLEQQLDAAQRGELSAFADNALKERADRDTTHRVLIYEALIIGHLEAMRLGAALHLLERWLETPSTDARPYYWRGLAKEQFRGQGEDMAVGDHRRALELDPDHVEARERLAELYLKRKDLPAARREFEEALRRLPDRPRTLVGYGRCLLALGDEEAGRRNLTRALELDPNVGEALRELGLLDLTEGKLEDAERRLRLAHERLPRDLTVCYNLANCLRRMGRESEAREFDQKQEAIKARETRLLHLIRTDLLQRPRDPNALYEAGTLYLDSSDGDDRLTGLMYLQRALDANPNHVPTLKRLAEYFQERGKPHVAERFRLRAGAGS